MSVRPYGVGVPLLNFEFLMSYHIVSLIKVPWYVLRVKNTGWEEKNGHPNILQYDWGFISFLTHHRIPQITVFDHFLQRIFLQVDFNKKLTIL